MPFDIDNDDLLSQALYVGEVTDDFDLNVPPATGEEYLRRVMHEAKRCEEIVVADIDRKRFRKQTVRISDSNGCQPAPRGYAANLEWQQLQVAEFSHVRQSLMKHVASRKKQKKILKPPMQLPLKDDDVGWCCLCFGNQLQQKLRKKKRLTNGSTDQDRVEDMGMDVNPGVPPLLSIVTSMSQPVIQQVLEYHVQWFEVTGFSEQQGRWLYALLACLEKPLTPETCSQLRSLVRLCCNLRASLDSVEDPFLAQLNLLICLVTRYFEQTDLADS